MTVRYEELAVPVDPQFAHELKAQLDTRRDRQHRSPPPSPANKQAIQPPRTTEVPVMLTPVKQPQRRWGRVGLIAAAVVAVLATGTVLVLVTADRDSDPQPAATLPPESSAPPTIAPASAPGAEEIDVAQRFVEARDAWDGEALRALLADDAVISDFDHATGDDYLLGAEFERVTAWRYMQPECSATDLGPPVEVTCTYTMQNAWSEALGVGPYPRSKFEFVIADGRIQEVRHVFNYSAFDPQVFSVFNEWQTATHPEDRDVMWNLSTATAKLTPESIALFEQHTNEFVASLNDSASD